MDTTTGALSIQEALQTDRPLLLGTARERPAIPIGKLSPPQSAPHPWDDLLRELGKQAPAEPLAAAVPAEFYYLRAENLDVFFKLSDQLDAWGRPSRAPSITTPRSATSRPATRPSSAWRARRWRGPSARRWWARWRSPAATRTCARGATSR